MCVSLLFVTVLVECTSLGQALGLSRSAAFQATGNHVHLGHVISTRQSRDSLMCACLFDASRLCIFQLWKRNKWRLWTKRPTRRQLGGCTAPESEDGPPVRTAGGIERKNSLPLWRRVCLWTTPHQGRRWIRVTIPPHTPRPMGGGGRGRYWI